MPTVLRVDGHRFFFFSNESNEPPHIHVESADQYAKFRLDPVELARAVGYNARELSWLRQSVQERREFFLEKWDEHFNA